MIFGCIFGSQLHVDIHDPIYYYLDRQSTRGILPFYMNSSLPLTRGYIAEMLIHLEKERDRLFTIDKKILDEYLADYHYELKDKPYFQLREEETTYHPFQSWSKLKTGIRDVFSYSKKQEDHHLVVHEKNNNLVWLDVGGIARNEIQNSDGLFIYSYRYSLSTIFSEKIVAYGKADLYEMLYNEDVNKMPPEYKGGFPGGIRNGYYGFKKSRGFDYSYGYLHYSSNIGDVILSMEPLIWGNTKNSIILSNNVNPFPALIWRKTIGKSRFTFLHGNLRAVNQNILSGSDINDVAEVDIANIDKYIVAHRWEITLSKKLRGAFTEMLIYGGRKPEFAYLIPPTLLWSVQHHTNNSDNILWFVESEYFPLDRLKLYNTIMIDELRTSKMFDNYIHNKWIVQGGAQYVYNIFDYPGSINFEITAARPWTYTHDSPETGTYTHNGRVLGFYPGPNTQLIYVTNRYWINPRNIVNIFYKELKWGEEPEKDRNDAYHFGNNPNEDYSLANPYYTDKTEWIIGDIKIAHTIGFLWEYQFSNIIELELGASHKWSIDQYENSYSIQINIDY